LHSRDLVLLLQLQEYFGCGIIYKNKIQSKISYQVHSIKDLTNKIISHFEKYQLLTQKAADFVLFKNVIKLMNNQANLTIEGLNQIINLRSSMNLGLSDLQKSEFPNFNKATRLIINTTNITEDS
jgi:LAGLIDADG endonuclease